MKSADALTLYAVLPETGDMPKLASAAIEGGATCIQLRLKGVSQEELAERCDISRNSVSLIETGKINPTIIRIIDIARVLDVDINTLVKDT